MDVHSGNDYRVATLSKSCLTTTEINMQSLESIGQFKLTKTDSYPCRTDVRTDPNYRKAFKRYVYLGVSYIRIHTQCFNLIL